MNTLKLFLFPFFKGALVFSFTLATLQGEYASAAPLTLSPTIPASEKNPLLSCSGNPSGQIQVNDANKAFELLSAIKEKMETASNAQTAQMETLEACLGNFSNCRDGAAKASINQLKTQVKNNIKRVRVYMALMHLIVDGHNTTNWSGTNGRDADGRERLTFLLPDARNVNLHGAPLRNRKLKHLNASMYGQVAELTDEELLQAIEIYNKDISEIMKGFRMPVRQPGGPQSEAFRIFESDARRQYFSQQIDAVTKFYQSKYAVLIGRHPILAFYKANSSTIKSDAELLASIRDAVEQIHGNAVQNKASAFPPNPRSWQQLSHLIMDWDTLGEHLKQQPQFCGLAHNIILAVRTGAERDATFRSRLGWVFFGAGLTCIALTGGACFKLGIAAIAVQSLLLIGDKLALDIDTVSVITNLERANPQKLLQIWARHRALRFNVTMHMISVGTVAGLIPISSTTALQSIVHEVLMQANVPMTSVLLIERIATKMQTELIDKALLKSIVDSLTAIEQNLAADTVDTMWYHLFAKKVQRGLPAPART